MTWYYYSGNISRPISTEDGVSKTAVPHSKIEILKMDYAGKALLRKKLLRRTSAPVVKKKIEKKNEEEKAPKKTVADVVERSDMAKAIAEKGVIKSEAAAPKALSGTENTEAEELANKEASEKGSSVEDKKKNKTKVKRK